MNITKVTKKLRVNVLDLIKFQLMTELIFIRKEHIIDSDMEFLTLLSLWGPMDLRSFCKKAALTCYKHATPEEIPTREQNVRNRMVKLEKRGFVIKSTAGKKQIQLADDIPVSHEGNILLDYNFLSIAS